MNKVFVTSRDFARWYMQYCKCKLPKEYLETDDFNWACDLLNIDLIKVNHPTDDGLDATYDFKVKDGGAMIRKTGLDAFGYPS